MSSNNTTTLEPYSAKLDLVQVRLDRERFPRLSSFTQEESNSRMERIVFGAFLYKGQRLDMDVIRLTAKALVAELLNDDKYGLQELTWEEIGRTVRLAVLGEGPELYGVNVSSLYGAILHYVKTEGTDARKRAAELKALQGEQQRTENASRLGALVESLTLGLEQNAKK